MNRMSLVARRPEAGATFCLNMIVRNEAHVIERCLDSVEPMLDYVRILDTGSTDNTVDLIRWWCKRRAIDCVVAGSSWIDFATNRNEALDLAGQCEATHLILIDADEILHIRRSEVERLRPMLVSTEQVLFSIPMVYGNNICTRTNLVRNLPGRLRYRYPIHEELILDDDPALPLTMIANPADWTHGPHVTTPQDGARSQSDDKLQRDVDALAEAYKQDGNPRHLFYMAQLMRIGAHIKGTPELWALVRETYVAYLRGMAGNYGPHCYVAALWVGRILEMEGSDKVIETYLRVHDFDPLRPEAMGCLANYCLEHGMKERAREFAAMVDGCRGSNNVAFLETKWYQRAKEILEETRCA